MEKYRHILKILIIPIIVIVISGIIVQNYIHKILYKEQPTSIIYEQTTSLESLDMLSYYPLNIGNYWVYDYTFDYIHLRQIYESYKNKPYENDFPIELCENDFFVEGETKVTVTNIYEQDHIVLVKLLCEPFFINFPFFPNYTSKDINKSKKNGLMIISNKVYYLNEDLFNKAIQYFKNGSYQELSEFCDAIEKYPVILFEFPFFDGLIYSSSLSFLVMSGFYKSKVELLDNKRFENKPVYKLSYSALTAFYDVEFVPYLGIIKFEGFSGSSGGKYKINIKQHNLESTDRF